MGSSRRRVPGTASILAAGVIISLFAGSAVAGAATGPIPQTDIESDTISLRVSVAADGSAAWRVAYRVELDDANTTEAFESLRADIEADPAPYTERFATRMRRTMWSAENATGREMSITNVSVTARQEALPQATYGVVVYRLQWSGFAAVDDERIRIGDAIDRFFLDERTSLTIAWPDRYQRIAVEPSATAVDNTSVTWHGRHNFGDGQPRVEIEPAPTPGMTPTDRPETPAGGGFPLVPIAVVAILLGTGVAVWFALRQGDSVPDAGERADPDGDDAASPPPELLSNEERVLQLLEDRGGRMKQQAVAGALDWTDAKTSQVVGELRDREEIEVFRLGRENVLTLPDVSIEPDDDE